GKEKIDLLKHCDVFILPSYSEGVPISILEAMSYGLAIISTNVGGIPSVVINNKNGILIEPGNKVMMVEAINSLLESPQNINFYSSNSSLFIKEYYPKAVKNRLIQIYDNI